MWLSRVENEKYKVVNKLNEKLKNCTLCTINLNSINQVYIRLLYKVYLCNFM